MEFIKKLNNNKAFVKIVDYFTSQSSSVCQKIIKLFLLIPFFAIVMVSILFVEIVGFLCEIGRAFYFHWREL